MGMGTQTHGHTNTWAHKHMAYKHMGTNTSKQAHGHISIHVHVCIHVCVYVCAMQKHVCLHTTCTMYVCFHKILTFVKLYTVHVHVYVASNSHVLPNGKCSGLPVFNALNHTIFLCVNIFRCLAQTSTVPTLRGPISRGVQNATLFRYCRCVQINSNSVCIYMYKSRGPVTVDILYPVR